MKRIVFCVFFLILQQVTTALGTRAQTPDQPGDAPAELFTDGELDLLLGPIALYPDPLIAVLLPAATQSSEIVSVVRFLNAGGDANDIEAQPWSDSVKALAYYAEVIRWMDENIEWTAQVGEAFLKQPEDVMDAIQRLREMARSLGNLQTTPEQIVEVADGDIDILPMDPDYVYVPVYEPRVVYSRPAAAIGGVRFDGGLSVGGWLRHDWDWGSRRVIVWNNENSRPRTWWTQSRAERFRGQKFDEWCPRARAGKYPAQFWADRAAGKPWQRNAGKHSNATAGQRQAKASGMSPGGKAASAGNLARLNMPRGFPGVGGSRADAVVTGRR
jgi:hypothetical protein